MSEIEPMEIQVTGSDSLCARARTMIAAGLDPATPIVWKRGETELFAERHPASVWASLKTDGSRFKRYRETDAESMDSSPVAAISDVSAHAHTETDSGLHGAQMRLGKDDR